MCDSSTQSVRARSINVVAERAMSHFRKPEVVRLRVHSANSLDDRFDSFCNGGSVDSISKPARKRDLYCELLATKATCDVQEKCRELKHDDGSCAGW